MIKSDSAFVLSVHPFKETSATVVLFTLGEGLKRAVAKGARRPKSKLSAALSPLNEITAHFYESERGAMVTLAEADLVKSALPLAMKLPDPFLLHYLPEAVFTFVQEGEASPVLYRLLRSCLDGLEEGLPPAQVQAYFDFWVLKMNGTLPPFRRCSCGAEAAHWDPHALKGRCARHALGAPPYPDGLLDLLSALRSRPVREAPAWKEHPALYGWLLGVFRDLHTHFVGKALKSYALLKIP
jgi:DNA repair protein RecO